MAQEVLLYLSLIVVISAALSVIARIIKQPPIIAYLITGILVGPLFFNFIGSASPSSQLIQIFAHLGVAFLLFIVGLSLDFRVLKEVGPVSLIAGIMQILITGAGGYFLSLWLGFSILASAYIAIALAFSSTVVVVKILSDKKQIDTLHGRIALGILIIQDFVAGLVIMSIPLIANHGTASNIVSSLGVFIISIAGLFLISHFVLPKVMDYLARNNEILFLFGIAWALILSTLFDNLGFSLEIGALIAGMTLASSKYNLELQGKIKPLRDFFVILFFVFFGSQLAGPISPLLLQKTLILAAFVLIGKPLIVMIILRVFGYKKRTNFLTGASLAQISEFSLILALLGFSLGHLSQEIMTLLILISIITITISSYSIYYADSIFAKISHLLFLFEGERKEKESEKEKGYDVILLGHHRLGYKILSALKKMSVSVAVADYNPKVILALREEKVDCFYGDSGDKYFLSELPIKKAKMIISTIPDESINLTIKEHLKKTSPGVIFIATAEQPRTALDLYKQGIDYVIVPHHLGGDYISEMIKNFGTRNERYKKAGKDHKKSLENAKNNSSFN